jgi:Ala-tRNA(Pro) deacylase
MSSNGIPDSTAYDRMVELLDREGAAYTIIDHPPEGRTEIVSAMRGHEVRDAAKCIILMVKVGKKVTRFVLAVIPGDSKVDMEAVKRLKRGTFIRFADTAIAEELAGSVSGTILPFCFDPRLELIVDSQLVTNSETIYFNAARLDRSFALRTADYVRIAQPRIESIATL